MTLFSSVLAFYIGLLSKKPSKRPKPDQSCPECGNADIGWYPSRRSKKIHRIRRVCKKQECRNIFVIGTKRVTKPV